MNNTEKADKIFKYISDVMPDNEKNTKHCTLIKSTKPYNV